MNANSILPVKKALEVLGLPETEESNLCSASDRFNSTVMVGGKLKYIDMTKFQAGVDAEIKAKIERAERRTDTKPTDGRKIGLLKARIVRAPGLIQKKQVAIDAARKELAAAQTAYDRARATKKLAELEAGLKRLQDNLVRDEAELKRLLDQSDE